MTQALQNTALQDARIGALERELCEFTHMVSHDLGAALRHLGGFAELLSRDAGNGLPPEQAIHIDRIRSAAHRCGSMLEQLVVYSRVQEKVLDIVECDAVYLMGLVRLQLSEAIARSGADIAVGALGTVRADRELLLQAFRCILDNAIRFHRGGVTPRIVVEPVPDASDWAITIADNGIGVADLNPEKLFAMFCRGQRESDYPGVGAGLAIARRILRRHGGDVRFAKSCIHGASVDVRLPRVGPVGVGQCG